MGYLLKINNAKQQINFLNCDNIDKWIDTCQEVTKSYDVIYEDIDLPIEGGSIGDGVLIFEFDGTSTKFSLNLQTFSATTSPYVNSLEYLGIPTTQLGCYRAFSGSSITNLIEFPDTSSVPSMYGMFSKCGGLTSINLSNFNTSNVTDMRYMFENCSGLTSLDLSGFDTSKVTLMDYMFRNCSELTSLDVSNFDTSKVTNMYMMFSGCKSLTLLDVSSFNTSNVTDMSYMFGNCSKLTSLDLSSFDTSKVTTMYYMFASCSGLTSLDLSSFDTRKVVNTKYMFYGCSNLTSLDLSNWVINDVNMCNTMTGMFSGCGKLKTIYMKGCDETTVSVIYCLKPSQAQIITE